MGGHLEACDHCDQTRLAYHSCRNRHCPQCQTINKERWLEARRREILPIRYFHLVFTLPAQLRPIAFYNQKLIYDLLFHAAAEALLELGEQRLGAELGAIMLLHTWSQQLHFHPHTHAIVTGGGLSLDGQQWISSRRNFLLSVRRLSRFFQIKFLAGLKDAYAAQQLDFWGDSEDLYNEAPWQRLLTTLYRQRWVVYAKPADVSARHVLDYLGRYTNRVALSNDRIVKFKKGQVTFKWRDSDHGNVIKRMTLQAEEFIRRFLTNVLPDGFVKIRHYGLLASRHRNRRLDHCRRLLKVPPPPPPVVKPWYLLLQQRTGRDPRLCASCHQGRLWPQQRLLPAYNRGPPWR